jgi:hypothetical protein
MKSRARDEVGVGNPKLHIGKPQFFAIFSARVCNHAPACHAEALKRWQVARVLWLQILVRWLSGRKQRFAKAP